MQPHHVVILGVTTKYMSYHSKITLLQQNTCSSIDIYKYQTIKGSYMKKYSISIHQFVQKKSYSNYSEGKLKTILIENYSPSFFDPSSFFNKQCLLYASYLPTIMGN